ncbi:hypothetical protein [Saccharothrix sp. 6-C]|nr:hypothetical protein [Saccharothrix sp. 6-C]
MPEGSCTPAENEALRPLAETVTATVLPETVPVTVGLAGLSP